MTTEEFIDALQRRALLPAEAIASLRQFVRKSLKIVTPESLAKMLVEKERITAREAEQLLNPTAAPVPARADDLSLAPIDDPRRKHLNSARNRAEAAGARASNSPPGKATTAAAPKPASAGATHVAAGRIPATENEKPPDRGLLDDLLAENGSPAGMHGSSVGLVGKRRPAAPKRVWIAAGGIMVLLFATAVALILTFRGNGDNEWLLAEKDFSNGSDLAAINRLDAFLDAFPKHPRTGAALVYRATARLRQAVAANTNWEQPLAVASDILPEIVEQPDFTKVRGTVGTILPEMAAGLARQAKDDAKRPLDQRRRQVQAALEGLALAKDPRYTPDSQKPWAILRVTEDDVAGLARAIDRDTELERAATEIRSSIAAGHIAAAFAVRDQLCECFPELRSDATVESLNQELAEGEVKFIKFDREPHKAPTQPRATPMISTVVFAARNDKLAAGSPIGSRGPGDDAAAIVVFTHGAAYWLSTADGTLLGRQFLGFDSSLPLKIESSKGAEFIVFDAVHRELARVSARAAAIRWRQPLGGPLAGRPSISGDKVYAVTRSGKLLTLDAESGANLRSAEFAEPFRSPPAISADGTKIALVSDRGNLFILAAKDLHSSAAASLVDDASAMTVAPVVFGNRLGVMQREGWENSVLRILAVGSATPETKSLQRIPLAGHLNSPPIVESDRLIVATDRGALAVLTAGGAANGPLPKIAELPPADGSPQPRFLAVRGSRIWLGGAGVAQYELTADASAPRLIWQRFAGDSILQSPALSGDLVIVARTRHDLPGAWVTALDSQTGEPKWETAVGAPLASLPVVEFAGKPLRLFHPLVGEIDRAAVPAEAQVLETAPMILPDSTPASFPSMSGPHENRQPARSWSLGIRAVWGPATVGDIVLEATDRELRCVDAKGGLLWKQALPDGPPVGAPLQRGGEFVFASATGTIWRVDRRTGDQKGMLDVGQPLASGPTLFNKRIVVAAADGSLLFIELP